jgi:hypothetical protein
LFEVLADFGMDEFDVLEIFKENFEALDGPLLREKFLGDVRKIDSHIGPEYDLVVFWHGPQMLTKREFYTSVPHIMDHVNKAFIIACPHGEYLKPREYRNPHEEHISHWMPEELVNMGFHMYVVGPPDKKHGMVGVLYKNEYVKSQLCQRYPGDTKVIAVTQCYNEKPFVRNCIESVRKFADIVLTTESCNTPDKDKAGWSAFSNDGTREELIAISEEYSNVFFVPQEATDPICAKVKSRTIGQGWSNRRIFNYGEKEGLLHNDDWIWIVDADEFYGVASARNIVRLLKTDYAGHHGGDITEWQFAYGMRYGFISSHKRFMKYKIGSSIQHVHNLVWPDGGSPWSKKQFIIDPREAMMFHLSYAKDPWAIRAKMLSFNRPRYINWFNNVYLEFPFNAQQAYKNNAAIDGRYGWMVGSIHPLIEFDKEAIIPACRDYADWDYIEDVRKHRKKLEI